VSFVLLEKFVASTFPSAVTTGSNIVPLIDPSLYVGAQIIAGNPGSGTQEVVTVTAVTASDFTAAFQHPHAIGETLRGATFPSGQVNQLASPNISTAANVAPLFSQAELLDYFRDVQNDFLERTRSAYAIATVALAANNPVATAPVDCIRLERIDIEGGAAMAGLTGRDGSLRPGCSRPGQCADALVLGPAGQR